MAEKLEAIDTTKLKVGDKLVYTGYGELGITGFTLDKKYIITDFYDYRYGIKLLDDNLEEREICMSLVKDNFKLLIESKEDKVNHPSHYTWLKDKCGIEVIDITRHLDFDLGNCIKYILRAGHKTEEGYSNKEKQLEDLLKAQWYLNDKINTLKEGKK